MAKQYLAFTKQDIDPSSDSGLLVGIIEGSENEKARSLLKELALALSSTLNR